MINHPQTPLEIGIRHNGLVTFVNKSSKAIAAYTLGCVIKKDNEIIITDQANPVEANLSKNEFILTPKGSGGNFEYSDQLKNCYDKKSKFSVVKVEFEDKSIWMAN